MLFIGRSDGVTWYNDKDKWPASSDRFKCDLLHAMHTHPSSTPCGKKGLCCQSDTLRGMCYAPFALAADVQSVPGFGHRVVIKAHVVFI